MLHRRLPTILAERAPPKAAPLATAARCRAVGVIGCKHRTGTDPPSCPRRKPRDQFEATAEAYADFSASGRPVTLCWMRASPLFWRPKADTRRSVMQKDLAVLAGDGARHSQSARAPQTWAEATAELALALKSSAARRTACRIPVEPQQRSRSAGPDRRSDCRRVRAIGSTVAHDSAGWSGKTIRCSGYRIISGAGRGPWSCILKYSPPARACKA